MQHMSFGYVSTNECIVDLCASSGYSQVMIINLFVEVFMTVMALISKGQVTLSCHKAIYFDHVYIYV